MLKCRVPEGNCYGEVTAVFLSLLKTSTEPSNEVICPEPEKPPGSNEDRPAEKKNVPGDAELKDTENPDVISEEPSTGDIERTADTDKMEPDSTSESETIPVCSSEVTGDDSPREISTEVLTSVIWEVLGFAQSRNTREYQEWRFKIASYIFFKTFPEAADINERSSLHFILKSMPPINVESFGNAVKEVNFYPELGQLMCDSPDSLLSKILKFLPRSDPENLSLLFLTRWAHRGSLGILPIIDQSDSSIIAGCGVQDLQSKTVFSFLRTRVEACVYVFTPNQKPSEKNLRSRECLSWIADLLLQLSSLSLCKFEQNKDGDFCELLLKRCLMFGLSELAEKVITRISSTDAFKLLKEQIAEDEDFALECLEKGACNSSERLMFLMESVVGDGVNNRVLDVLQKRFESFVSFDTMSFLLLHMCTPSSVCARVEAFLKELFFLNLNHLVFSEEERLREVYYRSLAKGDWQQITDDTRESSVVKCLVECFNRLSQKDLESSRMTGHVMSEIRAETFKHPSHLIDRAVTEAVSSKGKTLLIQDFFAKLPSLLIYRRCTEEDSWVYHCLKEASLPNINSACSFIRSLAASEKVDNVELFEKVLVPRLETKNKVSAVKLMIALFPHLPETHQKIFVIILERLFSKYPELKDESDSQWFQHFLQLKLIPEEIENKSKFHFDFGKKSSSVNGARKALTDYFANSLEFIVSANYDLSAVEVERPSWVEFSVTETSVAIYSVIRTLSVLDARALALAVKVLVTRGVVINSGQWSVNVTTWDVLHTTMLLCVACENTSFPSSLTDSIGTLTKGIYKWMQGEIGAAEGEEQTKVTETDVFLSLFHLLEGSLELCAALVKCGKEQMKFRDSYYFLLDEIVKLSDRMPRLVSSPLLPRQRDCFSQNVDKIELLGSCCRIALPNKFQTVVSRLRQCPVVREANSPVGDANSDVASPSISVQ